MGFQLLLLLAELRGELVERVEEQVVAVRLGELLRLAEHRYHLGTARVQTSSLIFHHYTVGGTSAHPSLYRSLNPNG